MLSIFQGSICAASQDGRRIIFNGLGRVARSKPPEYHMGVAPPDRSVKRWGRSLDGCPLGDPLVNLLGDSFGTSGGLPGGSPGEAPGYPLRDPLGDFLENLLGDL